MSTSLLSIVIARAGSKGLPSKCILPINGIPVIEYVIKWLTGINWRSPDGNLILNHTIAVSTDIPEVRKICKAYNVIYIQRGSNLAGDDITVEDVLYDAYIRVDKSCDYISLVYGNMITRYTDLIYDPLIYLNKNKDVDSVFSFQTTEKYNPAWMIPITDGLLSKDWKTTGYRRQDLPQLMIPDGHTQLLRPDHFTKFMKTKKYNGIMYEAFGSNIKPWIHDKLIIDIDTRKDYILSQAYINIKEKNDTSFR